MKLTTNLLLLTCLLFSCQKKQSTDSEKNTYQTTPPNVLFIMVDDLNDWVGYLKGHPQALTPNIDRLASQGMAFLNAHTNSPLCGPSRSSMLTGKLPSSTGIYFHIPDTALAEFRDAEMPEITFLPDYFEQQGYATYGVGKIFHWGDGAKVFDEYGGLSNFGPRPAERFKYDPEWFGKPKGTSTDWGVYPAHDSLTFDARIADWAIEKLQQPQEKPFLLAAGFMRPHVPWYAPQQWFDLFNADGIKLPPHLAEDWEDVPEMASKITDWPMMPEIEWILEQNEGKNAVHAYLASVAFVDHHIGRLLNALEKSPYAKNTLIVLASDHGYHLGEKGLFQKGTLWQRSTQIPMIVAGPKIKIGQTKEPASLLDIYPTLVNLCNFPMNPELEGMSLASLLWGEKEALGNQAITTYGPENHSVFQKDWHYIRYNDGSEELYDLADDPNEWNNLANDSSTTTTRQRLATLLPTINKPNIPASELGITPYFQWSLKHE